MSVRRGLRWTLALAAALALVAIGMDKMGNPSISQPDHRPAGKLGLLDGVEGHWIAQQRREPSSRHVLPIELILPEQSESKADLFNGAPSGGTRVEMKGSILAPQAGTRTVTTAAETPVVRQAPPFNARYLGRMTAPDGTPLIFVQDGAHAMLIATGAVHSSGYVVHKVVPTDQSRSADEGDVIHFVHAATGHPELLRLPMQNSEPNERKD